MNLRKTAVAVAIAGIAAAPLAATAETTISGIVQLQLKGESIGSLSDNVGDVTDNVTDSISDAVDDIQDQDTPSEVDADNDDLADDSSEDVSIGAGDVRVNIASVHDLNNGLQGYGNVGLTLDDLLDEEGGIKGGAETTSDLTITNAAGQESTGELISESTTPTVKADNVYVGIKGGFGDLRIGEIPVVTEYGQVANDIFDVASDIGDGISYTGVFGPATIGLNYALEAPDFGPDSNMIGAGAKVAIGGFSLAGGAGQYSPQDGGAGDDLLSFSVGGAFAFAGASVALQYWSRENDDNADGTEATESTNIGAKVGYGFGAVSANVTYEVLMDDPEIGGEDAEEQAIRLDVVYDMGGGMDLSTRITSFTNDDDDDREKTEYRLQLSKAF